MKKINFFDIFLSSIISLFFTNQIYSFLYGKFDCSYLTDFYISPAIIENHNKYLDFLIYFIYLVLVFLIIPVVFKLREKIKLKNFKMPKYKIFNTVSIKKFFIKYQYLGVLGYIPLHPFDGSFYWPVCLFVLALMIFGIFDARKRQLSNIPSVSPFCVAPLVFILFFAPYNNIFASADLHHFGEKYATYFMIQKYNLDIYKDIMLVHGFMDIIPSYLGQNLFGLFNLYGFDLGNNFTNNISILSFLIVFLYIFQKTPYLMLFLFIFPYNQTCFYFALYILLLKKEIIKKPYLWLFIYSSCAILLSAYCTTIGTFWVISSLPLAIFVIIKAIKQKIKHKALYTGLIATFLLIVGYFSFNIFSDYLLMAKEYIKGNLFAFGNGYGFYVNIFYYIERCFALFIVPFVIFELCRIKKSESKDISYIFFLIFALIFPFVSMGYSLGRIDYESLLRIKDISYAYWIVFVPYLIYRKYKIQNNESFKNICILLFILLMANTFVRHSYNNLTNIVRPAVEENKTFEYIGKMKLEPKIESGLIERKKLTEKYSDKKDSFLDLTNSGMNYLYFDKKIPIPFVSYYNLITTNQAKESVSKLEKNAPKVILIKGGGKIFEDVLPSVRINRLYRWLLLNKMYSLKEENGNAILIRNNKPKNLSEYELYRLDKILSTKNLGHLPEAWASSINKLPVKEEDFDFEYRVTPKSVDIKFKKPMKGKDIDLIYLEPVFSKQIYNKKFKTKINGSKSILYCDSKKGNILIPFDNFPSWLMNENIKEIKINIKNKGNFFESAKVKFYKKTN